MIEIICGAASVPGPPRRVLAPGDVAELGEGYEGRLVAAGMARYVDAPETAENGAEPCENVPESGENGLGTAQNGPETPEIVLETAEKDGEISENGGKQAEIAPEAPEKDPSEGDSAEVPAGSAGAAAAPGIPSLDELSAMKRPELEALAVQWGVDCRVGTTNAAIAEALAALAAEEAPRLDALGAVG